MSIENRLTKLEEALRQRPTGEDRFAELAVGVYDPTASLLDNLRRAELPEGAIPLPPRDATPITH